MGSRQVSVRVRKGARTDECQRPGLASQSSGQLESFATKRPCSRQSSRNGVALWSAGAIAQPPLDTGSHSLWCDAQLLDKAVRATNVNQERLSTAALLHFASKNDRPPAAHAGVHHSTHLLQCAGTYARTNDAAAAHARRRFKGRRRRPALRQLFATESPARHCRFFINRPDRREGHLRQFLRRRHVARARTTAHVRPARETHDEENTTTRGRVFA